MVWATARSVREERSRQRYAMQDFSLIKVSLVKGKSGWKVGSAESEVNYFGEVQSGPREARAAITSVIRLLRQFLHGEMAHVVIFNDVKLALEKISKTDDPHRIVDIFSLRFLHNLGYIANDPTFEKYLKNSDWFELEPLSERALQAISKAKQVSHL